VLYNKFSTVRKTLVTDEVIDWPLPKKILGCATAVVTPYCTAMEELLYITWNVLSTVLCFLSI